MTAEEFAARIAAWRERMAKLAGEVKPKTPAGGLMPMPKGEPVVPVPHSDKGERESGEEG